MSDVTTPETEEQDWENEGAPTAPAVAYPQFPENPRNHRFTLSIDGRGPMVVVRANTAAEIQAACEELEDHAVGAALGRAYAAFKAGAALGNGLGATPVAGPPAPPQGGMPQPPMPPQGNFNAPPPVPGVPGQAPAAWQNAGAPQGGFNGGGQGKPDRRQEYQQAGWYRLNVPFPKKGRFDGLTAQYQMRKGRPSEGGQFSFNSADKSWYVDPQYAGGFGEFSPLPA